MFLEFIFYFLLPTFILLYFYLKHKFSYFESKGIPHIKPGSFTLMGNMSGIGTEIHFFDRLKEFYEKLKGKDVLFGFYSSVVPNFVITDEELVKHVMIKDFNNFVNRGLYVNEEDEPLTGNLFAIEDDKWRFLRHKLSPVFTTGKLKTMFPEITSKAQNLVSVIDQKANDPPELKGVAHRFMVDIISSVAFGMNSNTLNGEHQRLMEMLNEIFPPGGSWAMMRFFILSTFPTIGKFFKLKWFGENVSEFFTNVVSGNIKYREDSKDERKDFLNMLIQLKNKGSIEGEISTDVKKLTLNEILAQAFLFMFAGSDTSGTTIGFALCELSHNQEIQERLRKEIEEKTKSTNGEISYEALHEMKYLAQVVDETLRMYPPAFFIFRKAKNDYKVPSSSHIIPKDSAVWIPVVGLHYDERFWPNPKKFDPERFTQEEIEKRSPYVYLPFGEGPRNCIGMRFGLLNVKTAIAMIVKNFKLTPNPKTPYPMKANPKSSQMDALGGFWVNFERIK